jgi:hypothetical protein
LRPTRRIIPPVFAWNRATRASLEFSSGWVRHHGSRSQQPNFALICAGLNISGVRPAFFFQSLLTLRQAFCEARLHLVGFDSQSP